MCIFKDIISKIITFKNLCNSKYRLLLIIDYKLLFNTDYYRETKEMLLPRLTPFNMAHLP